MCRCKYCLCVLLLSRGCRHMLLARYVKLRVAHAPGMRETFSATSRVSDLDMHHSAWLTNVPGCMPGLLISGFLWNRWRWKRSRHSQCMCNPHFYESGKRPMELYFSYYCRLSDPTVYKHRCLEGQFVSMLNTLWIFTLMCFGCFVNIS